MKKVVLLLIILTLIVIGGIVLIILTAPEPEPPLFNCPKVPVANFQSCCDSWAEQNDILKTECEGEWVVKDDECYWECDSEETGDEPVVGGCAGVSLENLQECCDNWAAENQIAVAACVGEWTIKNNQCAWECEVTGPQQSTTGLVPPIIVQLRDNLKQYPEFTEDLVDMDCDAENPCPDSLECYEFPEIGLHCVYVGEYSSPCDWFICPNSWNSDEECSIAESYPEKIICS